MDLEAALLDALRPRDTRERAAQLVLRGWTAMQVYERLPASLQAELAAGPENPTVGARQAVDRVFRALLALTQAGQVRRRRVAYGMILNTKGGRGMLVDVFRR